MNREHQTVNQPRPSLHRIRVGVALLVCLLLPPLGLLDDALQRRCMALAAAALLLLAVQIGSLFQPFSFSAFQSFAAGSAAALTAVFVGLRSARKPSTVNREP